jgi:hypothetical protein
MVEVSVLQVCEERKRPYSSGEGGAESRCRNVNIHSGSLSHLRGLVQMRTKENKGQMKNIWISVFCSTEREREREKDSGRGFC